MGAKVVMCLSAIIKSIRKIMNLGKDRSFEEIAKKGTAIYEKLKAQYEPRLNGKFLAIETDSGSIYMGDTSGLALEEACARHPDKMFYLVKIGSDAMATLALSLAPRP
jgi:hypothetical protein